MISTNQLTKEAGFEDGVVVEIVDEMGRVWFVESWKDEYGDSKTPSYESWISIRPLTGPMAIWNFAPEWADFLIVDHGNCLWQRGRRQDFFGDARNITDRPFWAARSKE